MLHVLLIRETEIAAAETLKESPLLIDSLFIATDVRFPQS